MKDFEKRWGRLERRAHWTMFFIIFQMALGVGIVGFILWAIYRFVMKYT